MDMVPCVGCAPEKTTWRQRRDLKRRAREARRMMPLLAIQAQLDERNRELDRLDRGARARCEAFHGG